MKPRFSWRTVALLAAAVVTALVAYGGVRFLSPGGSAPAAPTGLELTVGDRLHLLPIAALWAG